MYIHTHVKMILIIAYNMRENIFWNGTGKMFTFSNNPHKMQVLLQSQFLVSFVI